MRKRRLVNAACFNMWLREFIMMGSLDVGPVRIMAFRLRMVAESAGLPACLIERCCSCFCFWFVLVPLFSCCAFLLSLNRGHPPRPPPLYPSSGDVSTQCMTVCITWDMFTLIHTCTTAPLRGSKLARIAGWKSVACRRVEHKCYNV